MKKLDVRFDAETSPIIKKLAERTGDTFSKVARDAMETGLGIMMIRTDGDVSHVNKSLPDKQL